MAYISSSPLAAPFPPSHLCQVWCFIEITSNRGDRVGCGGDVEGRGWRRSRTLSFEGSELLDCFSCEVQLLPE